MSAMPKFKGVYCLECEWYGPESHGFTIEHILRVVHHFNPKKYGHYHYDVSTEEEFWFLLNRWTQRRFDTHPILYLGFHGEPGAIFLRNGKKSPKITLNDIRDVLAGKCNKRVIFFGSCETMYNKPHERKTFLEKTQALAICGYKRPIDWMLSAAMDLIVLSTMQEQAFTLAGMKAIAKKVSMRARGLKSDLGFRIYTREGEA